MSQFFIKYFKIKFYTVFLYDVLCEMMSTTVDLRSKVQIMGPTSNILQR